MRFLMMVSGGEPGAVPPVELVEAMSRYNDELARAGALLAVGGLVPSATRLTFSDGAPTVTDGPFTEAKELVGGYWIIQARSKEEAVEWASRAPLQQGVIEVRKIGEPSDYPPEIAEASRMSEPPPEQTVAE